MLYNKNTTIKSCLIPIIKDNDSKSPPTAAPIRFEPNAISFDLVSLKEQMNITPAKNMGKLRTMVAKIVLVWYPKMLKTSIGIKYVITTEAKSNK